MSLFGALFTGVSALTAQSQSIAMISNNIANVNTVGYKRVDAAFSSLVTTESRTARYTPGSVIANREARISQQGAIQQTNSTTDMSISGSGFFVVQRTPTGTQEALYTRAGSFSENKQGYLVNTAGYYLMGWPLDVDGNLPSGQAELSSLTPVDVAFLGGLSRPTSEANLAVNLDYDETPVAYPVSASQASHFTRGLRVYDSVGSAQDLEFQFVKSESPSATASSNIGGSGLSLNTDLTSLANIGDGDQLTIEVGGRTSTFTINTGTSVQSFINSINTDATLGAYVFAELDSSNQLTIKSKDVNQELTLTSGPVRTATGFVSAMGFSTATNYSTNTSTQGTILTPTTVISTLADADATEDLQISVGALGPVNFAIGAGTTVQNLIDAINADGTLGSGVTNGVTASLVDGQIRIRANNPNLTVTVADNVVAAGNGLATALGMSSGLAFAAPTFPATGDNIYPSAGLENTPNSEGWWNLRIVNLSTGAIENNGYINFNSDGSLNALDDADGENKIQLTNINWGNGSEYQDIDIQIGSFASKAGQYNVVFSDQNGAELGLRTGVEIDRDGTVIARFSNGQTANLYKVPLSTFTSPNALAEGSGNVYTETSESGSFNLREAGEGGSGLIEGSTLEASNVDLADEFSKMIITQRAYSAGTKVINTADEMTEELLRLR